MLPKDRARELLLAIAKEDPETRITDLPELERHSRALRVQVAVAVDEGHMLHLRVTDDGIGFDVKSTRRSAATRATRLGTGARPAL